MNCIYWFVEFVSYFASSNNDSELVESIICPSKVVFSIIHLLFPDTDGHWTQSIINSKVVLVVYNVKNKIFKIFIFGLICHIIFFFVFIYNVTLTNTISSLYMLYSLNNKICYNLKSPQFLCQPPTPKTITVYYCRYLQNTFHFFKKCLPYLSIMQ